MLEAHQLTVTTGRIKILSLILEFGRAPFCIAEIWGAAHQKNVSIGHSTLIHTLQLFRAREIIQIFHPDVPLKQGRPEIFYVLNENIKQQHALPE